MRILLTGAGGSAAISVWKSLRHEYTLYMADMDPAAAGLYLVPPAQRSILPAGNSPEFVQCVLDTCAQQHIELVISTVDAELEPLAAAACQFLQLGIKLPLCTGETLRICQDKHALLTHCKTLVPIPNTLVFTSGRVSSLHSFQHFPLFAKPRQGAGSNGTLLINKRSDLAHLPTDGSYLLQEILPGDEYSVDVYIQSNGQPLVAVPRLRMKVDSGIAIAAQTKYLPKLMTMAIQIANHVGIRYVANIQFKQAIDGRLKLLEINPRFPGTLPLTIAAGIDIPKLLIQDLQGLMLPSGLMPFKELMVIRYLTERFFPANEWEALCQT